MDRENDWSPKTVQRKYKKRDAIKKSNGMRENAISWRFMGKLISLGSFALCLYSSVALHVSSGQL